MDPDLANWLATTPVEADDDASLAEAREVSGRAHKLAQQRMNPALIPASETDHQIDSPHGPLPIRVLRPAGTEPKPTVVYFHGGGWIAGDIDTHLGHARRICTQADMAVVSVGYRLAPEHPFPAAFEDAVLATEWVAQRTEELGGEAGTLVLAGDSAGGQLAASVAIARRDAGQPVSAQLLLYPVTDVTGRYADPEVNARYQSRRNSGDRLGLTLQGMANFADNYVDEQSSSDWRVSPLRAADFTGLAPAVIHTATLDVLRTEGNLYGEALRKAGVRVISREWPTLNHSYFGFGGVSAVVDGAAAQAAEDLRQLLAGGSN
jgi:acetyl esterase